MIENEFLTAIGFTDSMVYECDKYKEISNSKILPYAKAYMNDEMELNESLTLIHTFASENFHEYTIDLLFVLECSAFLREKYKQNNIPEEMFIDAMKDIKYKVDECLSLKKVFGTFVIDWFEGFFKLTRVAFGRLQFDINKFEEDELSICDYTVKKGDFILNCHIPSSGPLRREDCYASYKMAYNYLKNELKNGILPIFCRSWLLYPAYLDFMDKKSNIVAFSKDYEIYGQCDHETFLNMWRIFGKEDDVDNLPGDTSLQKKFLAYMKNGGKHGSGKGLLLFDGEKILTKNN